MKLDDCKKCEFFMEHVSDSVLCRFNYEIEHRVLNGNSIVNCPKAPAKKGLSKLFHRS